MELPIDQDGTVSAGENGLKRAAPAGDLQGEAADTKKPKISRMLPPWIFDDLVVQPDAAEERKDITDDLEAGTHTLWLEHNSATNAKCRAPKCLPRMAMGKVKCRYRLNLEANQPSGAHWSQLQKPNKRFYHVACFEAIGVDVAMYITLAPEWTVDPFGGVQYQYFHPAIVDWVTSKGKAFDGDLYDEFDEALRKHRHDVDRAHDIHRFTCKDGPCVCGLPMPKPKSSDFISGEPSERTLVDVLLGVIGATPLMPLNQQLQLLLLEYWGAVPEGVTKAAIEAEKAEAAEEAKAEEQAAGALGQDDGVDNIPDGAKDGAVDSVAGKNDSLQESGIVSSVGTTNKHGGTVDETAGRLDRDNDVSNGREDGVSGENGN